MNYIITLLLILFSFNSYCLTLKPNAPAQYVIQEGDTLWEIACRFLVNPWEWKELLNTNPQIKNPNHLFPGDILALRYQAKKTLFKGPFQWCCKIITHIHHYPLGNPIPRLL